MTKPKHKLSDFCLWHERATARLEERRAARDEAAEDKANDEALADLLAEHEHPWHRCDPKCLFWGPEDEDR